MGGYISLFWFDYMWLYYPSAELFCLDLKPESVFIEAPPPITIKFCYDGLCSGMLLKLY